VTTSFNIIVKGEVGQRSQDLVLWAAVGVVGGGAMVYLGGCVVFLIYLGIYKRNKKLSQLSLPPVPIELAELQNNGEVGGGQIAQVMSARKIELPIVEDNQQIAYDPGNETYPMSNPMMLEVPEISSRHVQEGIQGEYDTHDLKEKQQINPELKPVVAVETKSSSSEYETDTDVSGESEPEAEGESGSEWETDPDASTEYETETSSSAESGNDG